MALGEHWEWRGFGQVSNEFRATFDSLAEAFPLQNVVDDYLWVPGLEVNAKLREGVKDQKGLKFKRRKAKRADLEYWTERPDEVFLFPLGEETWQRLAKVLAAVDVDIGAIPAPALDRDATIEALKRADDKVHWETVKKVRGARLWKGRVKVELAEISAPETITSVGLECWAQTEDEAIPPDAQITALTAAVHDLGLNRLGLAVGSYMDAVREWVAGGSAAFWSDTYP